MEDSEDWEIVHQSTKKVKKKSERTRGIKRKPSRGAHVGRDTGEAASKDKPGEGIYTVATKTYRCI